MWCGIANGAEDILIPEGYDYDAEGIGHSTSMARRIEAATGVETRATILGYMQRGGNPTCRDRVYATMMGALAVDLLCEGKTNRVVGYTNEALGMNKGVSSYMTDVARDMSR